MQRKQVLSYAGRVGIHRGVDHLGICGTGGTSVNFGWVNAVKGFKPRFCLFKAQTRKMTLLKGKTKIIYKMRSQTWKNNTCCKNLWSMTSCFVSLNIHPQKWRLDCIISNRHFWGCILRHTKHEVFNQRFLQHALFFHVCYRSLYIISV